MHKEQRKQQRHRNRQRKTDRKQVRQAMFKRIHRDTYSVLIGVLLLAGVIAVLLITLNPVR